MIHTIEVVMVGQVEPFGPPGHTSAIRKAPVNGPVHLGPLGLAGDHQSYHAHGGPDKALLHYPAEQYEQWAARFPAMADRRYLFGENIATVGMDEQTVCIGDRYRIGAEVVVEVSQPRQPCWKLGWNAGEREIAALMQELGHAGWYYRVVTPGPVCAGDTMVREAQPYPAWSIYRVFHPFYNNPLDRAFLHALTELPPLSAEWREAAARRLTAGVVEDWRPRLYGSF